MQKIMKAALAVCLVAVIGLGMTACGKSEEVKNCEQLIKAIDSDITLDNCGAVGAAGLAYESLTEEDAKKVDTSALDAAEKKLLEVTGSPFQACKELMGNMKDPSSFRIYGDVSFLDLSAAIEEWGDSRFVFVTCDAKNGLGGYSGRTVYQALNIGGYYFFASENDDDFIDFSEFIYPSENSNNPYKDKVAVSTFSGKRIAELIGCEYMG